MGVGVLEKDIGEVILSEKKIAARVEEIAKQLENEFRDKDAVFICILNGAVMFYVNLIMNMDMPIQMNFMRVSSYGASTVSSGSLRIIYDIEVDLTDRNVVVVEDIIDSGNTLKHLVSLFNQRGAKSVTTVCLLDKPSRRVVDIEADYVGFVVEDQFLVGYGLDYAGKYRNLEYIGTLLPEVYEK